MDLKTLLLEDIEREHEHLLNLNVGDEEYNASMKRLNILEDKLFDLEKLEAETAVKNRQTNLEQEKFEFESTMKRKLSDLEQEKFKFETEAKDKQSKDEKKDRFIRNVLEGVKVGSGIVIPIIGLVWITAAEKEITFTGALKGYASLFVPKKIN